MHSIDNLLSLCILILLYFIFQAPEMGFLLLRFMYNTLCMMYVYIEKRLNCGFQCKDNVVRITSMTRGDNKFWAKILIVVRLDERVEIVSMKELFLFYGF